MKDEESIVLTGAVRDASIFEVTSRRKLKQPRLLNTHTLHFWASLMYLLYYETQTLWIALLYARRRVTTFLRRRRRRPRREVQTRRHLRHHRRTLRRQVVGADHANHQHKPHA